MLLENINSNMEDMIKMASGIQSLTLKQAQTESQNRTLRLQVHQLRERNEQLSLSILKDQKKISKVTLELETAKKDITEYLKMIDELRQMRSSLEEKSDEMVEVIRDLREQLRLQKESPRKAFEREAPTPKADRIFISEKEGDKRDQANYDTNIRESKVIPSGNPMAQTKKFPGVVSNQNSLKQVRSRQASKKAKRGEQWSLPKGSISREIRELPTDSSRTSRTENKIDEKGALSVKNRTQPEVLRDEKRVQRTVYNSHRPDSKLDSLGQEEAIERIRSRSKPMKHSSSGAEIRTKYQAMRSKQKVKLYKRLKTDAMSKDIEKRLKMASKSPKRDNNYLGLESKAEAKSKSKKEVRA